MPTVPASGQDSEQASCGGELVGHPAAQFTVHGAASATQDVTVPNAESAYLVSARLQSPPACAVVTDCPAQSDDSQVSVVIVLNKQVAWCKAGVGGKIEQKPKDSINIKVPEGACADKQPKQRSTSTKLTERQRRATPEHKCDRRCKPDPKPKQLEPPAPACAAPTTYELCMYCQSLASIPGQPDRVALLEQKRAGRPTMLRIPTGAQQVHTSSAEHHTA